MPFPMKVRRTLPGAQGAAELWLTTVAPPNSRRLAARAVSARGAAAGLSLLLPFPARGTRPLAVPVMDPAAAAARGAAEVDLGAVERVVLVDGGFAVRVEAETPGVEVPDGPAVSADAIGIDAIADPTPNATARAPTRPTKRAWANTAGVMDREGCSGSMAGPLRGG